MIGHEPKSIALIRESLDPLAKNWALRQAGSTSYGASCLVNLERVDNSYFDLTRVPVNDLDADRFDGEWAKLPEDLREPVFNYYVRGVNESKFCSVRVFWLRLELAQKMLYQALFHPPRVVNGVRAFRHWPI